MNDLAKDNLDHGFLSELAPQATLPSFHPPAPTSSPTRAGPRCGALLVPFLALALCASAARADETIVAERVQAPDAAQGEEDSPPLVLARRSGGAGGDTGPAQAAAFELPGAARSHEVLPRGGLLIGFGGAHHPVRADVIVRLHEYFTLGASVGGIPAEFGSALLSMAGVKDATLSSLACDASVLFFPARGSFFLGATAGSTSLSATGAGSGAPLTLEAEQLYVTPRLGWFAIWEPGFSFGFDLGVQLPVSSKVVATGGRASGSTSPEGLVRALVEKPLPTLSLRVGWMM